MPLNARVLRLIKSGRLLARVGANGVRVWELEQTLRARRQAFGVLGAVTATISRKGVCDAVVVLRGRVLVCLARF